MFRIYTSTGNAINRLVHPNPNLFGNACRHVLYSNHKFPID